LYAFVIFLFQGEKGESGSPGKDGGVPRHGAIKFGDTADVCKLDTAGTVRYNPSQNALQLCDGSAWLSVVTAGKGHVAYNPGSHCLDILNSGELRMEQHLKQIPDRKEQELQRKIIKSLFKCGKLSTKQCQTFLDLILVSLLKEAGKT